MTTPSAEDQSTVNELRRQRQDILDRAAEAFQMVDHAWDLLCAAHSATSAARAQLRDLVVEIREHA